MDGGFKQDLARGRLAELKVKMLIEDKTGLPVLLAPDEKFEDYDLRLDKRDFKGHRFETLYEVKEDFGFDRTGNVAIEYGNNGQPSGILKSKADTYVIVCGNKAHFVERNVLLHDIFTDIRDSKMENLGGEYDKPNMRGHITKGGDGNQSNIYLMRYSRLKELSKTHDLPI
jgi:hypothetical protein